MESALVNNNQSRRSLIEYYNNIENNLDKEMFIIAICQQLEIYITHPSGIFRTTSSILYDIETKTSLLSNTEFSIMLYKISGSILSFIPSESITSELFIVKIIQDHNPDTTIGNIIACHKEPYPFPPNYYDDENQDYWGLM